MARQDVNEYGNTFGPNLPINFISNPTFQAPSQFVAPFNILPEVIYTNPTAGRINSFQFKPQTFTQPTYTGNPTYTSNNFTTSLPPKPNTNAKSSEFQVNVNDRVNWSAEAAEATNITLGTILTNAIGTGVNVVSGVVGIPQVAQSGQQLLSLANNSTLSNRYATLELQQLKPLPGIKYADFRQRRVFGNAIAGNVFRLDGAAAAIRSFNGRTALYAAASANPYGGAYAVFNLNGNGITGFGWGSHDDPYAIRNDFTLRSHVATKWDSTIVNKETGKVGAWTQLTAAAPERYVPFRGDRVNVIDFGKRIQKNAYLWNPRLLGSSDDHPRESRTQDLIKFYFTGPNLLPMNQDGVEDDIIVFRAIIGQLSDSFAPAWTPVTMLGRADANQHYTGYSRDFNLDFTVYATDRDELKPIWRKLNALAGYTAPIYNNDFSLGAPWMRITIGDLFRQQPVILTSLSYTLNGTDSTWEINIEDDPEMMQVPHKVDVSCGFTYIGNELPQFGGRFYSLAKQYDTNALPKKGSSNWLSDFKDNSDVLESTREKPQKSSGDLPFVGPTEKPAEAQATIFNGPFLNS